MKTFLYRILPYFLTFLVIEALVRLSLGIAEWKNLSNGIISLLSSMGVGFLADIATFLYILPLLLLIQYCIPRALYKRKSANKLQGFFYAIFLCLMLFTTVGQWLFWNELTSRFNFIAVDYLIYMDEVVGNIWETYPVVPIVLTVALLTLLSGCLYAYRVPYDMKCVGFRARLTSILGALMLAVGSFLIASENTFEFSDNRYENEIAKNGLFSLFSAFRNNELSYEGLYLTEKRPTALANLRQHLSHDGYPFTDDRLTRHISAQDKEIHPNIVLITVESLSADYMGAFGNTENLTPNLDRLAKESLFFTDLYATGTRTVYGLSAITLSIPPIPGNAIVRRPHNDHLFSLGSVLSSKGYDSRFIYGGYGYFDNMNAFFSGNGYRIIDRSKLEVNEITFANIWGVCDGDIYARTLKENDASYAKGEPFFDMIMTTSNHQPFTYPDADIDIPSGSGRLGGVKYTDHAIGRFIEEAKKHPWFDDTIFVIVADHTAGSSGKLELTSDRHHIPMLFYAPKLIKPKIVNGLASQIDLAPTLLGVMNMNYDSRFYGRDLLKSGESRAFIANYQRIGLLKSDSLTVLKPRKGLSAYSLVNGEFERSHTVDNHLLAEAIAYFQNASRWKELNQAIEK